MRYFRANVYFESASSRSAARILSHCLARKNIFLANQRGGPAWRFCHLLHHEVVFLIDRVSCLAREDSRKKNWAKLKKSQAVTRAQFYNIRQSIFTADLSKVYRKFVSRYAISTLLINFLMFWGQTQKLLFEPKNIILKRNNSNNLVWLKMGKWVTKCSIETLKLAPCTLDFC